MKTTSFYPLEGNPLESRDDLVRALQSLYEPLLPCYSKGHARVRLDHSGTTFDSAAADLEGFARPLWGLVSLALGGGDDFVDWSLFCEGLANGTNPEHPEFWGDPVSRDQRLVELCALGFALSAIPHLLWTPQTPSAKACIRAYLQKAYLCEFGLNNWRFFRILIGLGLERIGSSLDEALFDDYLDKLDALFLGDGWYRDGPACRADHYVGFALHFYALLFCQLCETLPRYEKEKERIARYLARAHAFAPEFLRWFSEEGAVLPYGRSLTYRFACTAFWSAYALSESTVLSLGVIKGLILRHLRWWQQHPIARQDGVLSVGYGYPNLLMSEPYNSGGSPYWALKAFACLALPKDHPFWTSPELPLPKTPLFSTHPKPGMVIFNPKGDAIALVAGQEEQGQWLRMAPEKYCKFAYSAHYAFSIESDFRQFEYASFDNMLAFSLDGRQFYTRTAAREAKIAGNLLYLSWQPTSGIEVETWLLAAPPWHLRLHRIRSAHLCHTIEGGFALACDRTAFDFQTPCEDGAASFGNPHGFSGICDVVPTPFLRKARLLFALPNTHLIFPRCQVPQLRTTLKPGISLLAGAVLVLKDRQAGEAFWQEKPSCPDLQSLETKIAQQGMAIDVMNLA